MRLVDHLKRSDEYATPRPMQQVHLGRNQVIDPIFDDRVRLASADFHEYPRLGDDPTDFADHFLSQAFVSIFIEVFHMSLPMPQGRSRQHSLQRCTKSPNFALSFLA